MWHRKHLPQEFVFVDFIIYPLSDIEYRTYSIISSHDCSHVQSNSYACVNICYNEGTQNISLQLASFTEHAMLFKNVSA